MSGFDLKPVLTAWLKGLGKDVEQVIEYDEEHRYGGYCETCSYDEYVVEITYLNSKNKRYYYTFYGTLGSLIRELENVEV